MERLHHDRHGAHIQERADKFFKGYIDPKYRAPFNRLCEAIAFQGEKGDRYALFASAQGCGN